MKKVVVIFLSLCLLLFLGACSRDTEQITVISREEASGTRSAFVELAGIEEEGIDRTYPRAEINSSTAVVMQTVMGNKNAIGYISLGALSGEVRALCLNRTEATVENIREGRYPLARPFFLVTRESLSPQGSDFFRYIMSEQGQKVISDEGYVSMGGEEGYASSGLKGTVKLMGSSSVAPLVEKLAEGYMALNPYMTVQVQTSDSTQGISSLLQGLCHIAMSSRELKEGEEEQGLSSTAICKDGIAVIVNVENPVTELNIAQLRSIFMGEITSWDYLQ